MRFFDRLSVKYEPKLSIIELQNCAIFIIYFGDIHHHKFNFVKKTLGLFSEVCVVIYLL